MNDLEKIDADETDVTQLDMANAIRFLAVDAVQKANSGHPGMPMGAADFATVLYSKFLILAGVNTDPPIAKADAPASRY